MTSKKLNPRSRNMIVSLIASMAAILVAASACLLTGALPTDVIRVSYFLYGVAIYWMITIVVVSIREDDKADRMWLGACFGVSIIISILGAVGVQYQIFANAQVAQVFVTVVTMVDAILAILAWVHTCFVNDDFVK